MKSITLIKSLLENNDLEKLKLFLVNNPLNSLESDRLQDICDNYFRLYYQGKIQEAEELSPQYRKINAFHDRMSGMELLNLNSIPYNFNDAIVLEKIAMEKDCYSLLQHYVNQ